MSIEQLYEKFERDLMRFACSIARDGHEAADLVQETFLKAMSNMELIKILPEYKQKAWLFTTLKHCLLDIRRREKTVTPLEQEDDITFEDDFDSKIQFQNILAYLPERLQDIVYKHYVLGMTSRQIAKVLSIPDATVRYHLHTARKIIKNKMDRRL